MKGPMYSEGRDVKLLLGKHKDEVEKLRKMTEKIAGYDAKEHDDIFFLRYILSNGTAKKSLPLVEFTITYRSDPVNKYYLEKCKLAKDGLMTYGLAAKFREMGLGISQFHCKGTLDGGPVLLIRQPRVEMTEILGIWTHEELVRYNNLQKEHAWLQCDKLTRETGRLVKFTLVTDFRGMKFQRPDNRIMNAFSESSKISEKMYPQLVETTVLANAPSWSAWVIRLCKLFISKKTMAKFKICTADTRTGDVSECPYLRERFDSNSLPTFLGGLCDCEGGCIPGLSNDEDDEIVPSREEVEILRNELEKIRKEEQKELDEILKK